MCGRSSGRAAPGPVEAARARERQLVEQLAEGHHRDAEELDESAMARTILPRLGLDVGVEEAVGDDRERELHIPFETSRVSPSLQPSRVLAAWRDITSA